MRQWWTIALVLLTGPLLGQDIHFSQFNLSPLTLNPAMAGQFEGDYRFAGIQRRQWNSVTVNPFQTFGLSADAHEPLYIDGAGAGVSIYNDRVGDSQYNTLALNFTGSYAYVLPFDSNQTVTGGMQIGLTYRRLDPSALTFDAQYNGFRFDPSLSDGENFDRTARFYPNIHTGVTWAYQLEEGRTLRAGFSLFNITKPRQSFFNDAQVALDRRYNIHADYVHPINAKNSLLPSLLFQRQGRFMEFVLGSSFKHILDASQYRYRAVYAGLWMRAGDAGFVSLGMDYDKWHVGLSYDFNLSGLNPASNFRGGWELAVIHILKDTLPERKRFKRCPTYL